jgi:hypothetical protein
MGAVVSYEACEIAHEKCQQSQHAGNVDQQDQILQLIEFSGVLCGATQEVKSKQRQSNARRAERSIKDPL